MWQNNGSIWVYMPMPIITIEPGKGPDENPLWYYARCGGKPVPQIPPSTSIGELMMQTVKYYDGRIEMQPVKEKWEP